MQSEQFAPAFGVGAVVLARRHLAGVLGLRCARMTILFCSHLNKNFPNQPCVWKEKTHTLFILCPGRAWYPGRVVKVTHLDSTADTEAGHR